MQEKLDVIITINKPFLDQILTGEKRVEFRKSWPTKPIDTVWFCEKGSQGKIRGRATAFKTELLPADNAWNQYGQSAGVNESIYLKYIGHKKKIFCIQLSNVRAVDGISLVDLGLTSSPQNFSYVKI